VLNARRPADSGDHRHVVRTRVVLDDRDCITGPRLKRYSRTADAAFWTEQWSRCGDSWYGRELRGHLPHQLRATFKRWVPIGARTLEAGCGLGHFTVAADAQGYQAEGLDWSVETIERLRRRFSWIEWHVGDARKLGFRNGTFDAVYSPGVCEHFEEGPGRVLAETYRVLRPGGIAVVSTPCFNRWLQRRTSELTVDADPGDLAFFEYAFTPDGMARVLERLGFEVVQILPYGVLDTFVTYGGWRVPRPMTRVLAFSMDYVPIVRQWGSTCIWVARKR
jgi:SAM-dependent methyltransferase